MLAYLDLRRREADGGEAVLDLGPFARDNVAKQQRQFHVLVRREHRQQVVELEDEADVPRPPAGQLALGHLGDFQSADDDAARRLIQPGDQVQERRLASGRPP